MAKTVSVTTKFDQGHHKGSILAGPYLKFYLFYLLFLLFPSREFFLADSSGFCLELFVSPTRSSSPFWTIPLLPMF